MAELILIVLLVHLVFYRWRPRDRYWYGPRPTREQKADAENFISDYISENIDNCGELAEQYPEAYKRAKAVLDYNTINQLRESGLIDEITYELELQKILPAIDISELAGR